MPFLHYIIAGDGNKKIDLEQMVERHLLHGRVTLLPACKHHEIPSVLLRDFSLHFLFLIYS